MEQASLFEDAVPDAPRWAIDLLSGQLAQIASGGGKLTAKQRAKIESVAVAAIANARRAIA